MPYLKPVKRKISKAITNPIKFINFHNILKVLIIILIITYIGPLTVKLYINSNFEGRIYSDIDSVPETRVAIVFGAGLKDFGNNPSTILEDRVETAVELYNTKKVQKIIMSGDNRIIEYNEPQIMINSALKKGVKDFDLQPDFAGRHTYDTCLRAREVFGISKAILVTQQFHLPRALYICNTLGIDAIGVTADRNLYPDISSLRFRETIALSLAFWQLYVITPEVVLGEKISI